MMLKDLLLAIGLTVLFSIGVGVLFVRTIAEMLDIIASGDPKNVRNRSVPPADREANRPV